MNNCLKCQNKDKKITEYKGYANFHEAESNRWRDLFNEQRGGEVFNDLQRRYADQNVENSKLRLELKKLKRLLDNE